MIAKVEETASVAWRKDEGARRLDEPLSLRWPRATLTLCATSVSCAARLARTATSSIAAVRMRSKFSAGLASAPTWVGHGGFTVTSTFEFSDHIAVKKKTFTVRDLEER